MAVTNRTALTWFPRFLLPAFAFVAVAIGDGYGAGGELAEFFLPSGLCGVVAAMRSRCSLGSVGLVALIASG